MPASVTPSTARAAKPGASTAGAAARLRAGPVQRGADRSAPRVLAAAAGRRADGPAICPACRSGRRWPWPSPSVATDGELRAQAVAAVVGRAVRGSSLPAILDFCRARENEQDPVRLAMLTALAALPPSRWEAAHLPGFTALIDAALRARDCSHQTMAAATQWLMAIIAAHAASSRRCPAWWSAWAAWAICATGIGNPHERWRADRNRPHLMSLLDTWSGGNAPRSHCS